MPIRTLCLSRVRYYFSCNNNFEIFYSCFECECNAGGSIDVVCDNITGECKCKEFVTGMNCDACIEGFNLLDPSNPFGCTKGMYKK